MPHTLSTGIYHIGHVGVNGGFLFNRMSQIGSCFGGNKQGGQWGG